MNSGEDKFGADVCWRTIAHYRAVCVVLLDNAPSVRPPFVVRLAMFGAYCYVWLLGVRGLCAPWAAPADAARPAEVAMLAISVLTGVYAADAALAASPLHWCCMRSIPPKNVVQHHVPFVVGMAFPLVLAISFPEPTRQALVATPACMTYMASGCLTSSNEALWVVSSFFTPATLDGKPYRVGQKLSALCALTQFILLGGVSAVLATVSLLRFMAKGELVFVRACMVVPMIAFFVVVPFVQFPLWKGALSRLIATIQDVKTT